MHPCLKPFQDVVRRWFEASFQEPTDVQSKGFGPIAKGAHTLLLAPTGSGKTLAAFLWAIDRLTRLEPEAPPGVRVLYVSPLKALAYDVDRNLRAPLVGIGHGARHAGRRLRAIDVDVRTGDTSSRDRRQQAKNPRDILVTTPESLFLILGSQARDALRTVHTVIIDEVHALAPAKRGVHLALSLERLAELTESEPQRIGLSATVRPADEVARFLGGHRPVKVVDATSKPRLDLEVVVATEDMERPDDGSTDVLEEEAAGLTSGPVLGAVFAQQQVRHQSNERGIWPTVYPELLETIRNNRSTIVFVNSRGLCERLSQRLNEMAEEELVRAHHGSVSREKRLQIEEALKAGTLKGIIATSSLELGIDMGAVDAVVMVESPGSVARGLQRAGRAGHHVGAVSVARIYPKYRGDLLECAVVGQRMLRGELEPLRVPRNALDVLSQQVVAMCVDTTQNVDTVFDRVRRAYPYADLTRGAFDATLDMLAGNYPSAEFGDLRPRLRWDRTRGELSARRGTAMISRLNAGTIPDRGNYVVVAGEGGPRVGELDEEMVFETRAGDTVILGASTWRVEQITQDRVMVSPAPGEPGRLPFWRGDGPGRPIELGRALGAFLRERSRLDAQALEQNLGSTTPLGPLAAQNLAAYLYEQREHTGQLPTDRTLVVEQFRDELGDWRICILSPFGARVHAPWAMAIQAQFSRRHGYEVQVMYTDDGIALRFADAEQLPPLQALVPEPEEVEELVTAQLGDSALFAALFRENAARALLLPRRQADKRNPLWAQRIKSRNLYAVVRRYPSFPVMLETYRHALKDVFDIPALVQLLRDVRSRALRIHEVETRTASPFARSLVFAYVAAYIYDQDSPLPERRAQALSLDRALLAELLGEAELRELIDAEVLADLELLLQNLQEDRRARDADEVHDLLRRLGDLTAEEIAARTVASPEKWLEQLQEQRRAVAITLSGETRWIAAHDAGLYRDALGVMPPLGLPEAYLDDVDQALPQLLRRYAKTHGPFGEGQVLERYGCPPGVLRSALQSLENEGALVHGAIRPGGLGPEWCHEDVLRRLKQGTLAKLRREVAPVSQATLASFLASWHGVGRRRGGLSALEDALLQLEGHAVSWTALNKSVLPARVSDYRSEMLDALTTTGAWVWVGRGALGPRDGAVAIYRRDRAALLVRTPAALEDGTDIHTALLEHLQHRGASFLSALREAVRNLDGVQMADIEAALWDLVWAGWVTNDTFAPLRSLGRKPRTSRRPGPALATGGRWWRVDELLDASVSETERRHGLAEALLQRYGVVTREVALGEDTPGGFSAVYSVLKAMEERGQVRRGNFVEGLGGAQFALPGALDRLRASRTEETPLGHQPQVTVLGALDPANPYGTVLPWPNADDGAEARPRRVPGAWVILVDGALRLYVGVGSRSLLTFRGDADDDALVLAFEALAQLPRGMHRRRPVVQEINGVTVRTSPHYADLKAQGLEEDPRGLALPL